MTRPLIQDGALVQIDGLVGTLHLSEQQAYWRFDWASGPMTGRRYYEPRPLELAVRRGTIALLDDGPVVSAFGPLNP